MRTTKLLFLTVLLAGILPSAFAGPLHDAAEKGDTAIIQQLLKSGTDTETRNEHDRTPLMWAAGFGQFEVVQILVDHGADVNAKTKWGPDVLSHAIPQSWDSDAERFKKERVVELLLSQDAKISRRHLRLAAISKSTGVLRMLVQKREGNIDEDLGNGETMLMLACKAGQIEPVRFLLKQGADVTAKNEEGRDVLMFCEDESVRSMIEESRQKQGKESITNLLKFINYDSSVLVEALITAKNKQLPDFLATATDDQKVDLLTSVEKQIARATAAIDTLNAQATAAITDKKDPVPFRNSVGQIKAYIGVLNEIKSILEQS